MKLFQEKYKLSHLSGRKNLLNVLLSAHKEFSGNGKSQSYWRRSVTVSNLMRNDSSGDFASGINHAVGEGCIAGSAITNHPDNFSGDVGSEVVASLAI